MVKNSAEKATVRTYQRSEGLKRSQTQAWSRSVVQRRSALRRAAAKGGGVGARQFRAASFSVRAYRGGRRALQIGLEDLNHMLAGSPIKAVVDEFTGSMFEIMFNRKEVENYGKMVLAVIQMGRMPGAPTTKTTAQGDTGKPFVIKQLNAKRRGILWSFGWGNNLLTPDTETVKGFQIWQDRNPYRAKWDMPFPDDRPLGFVSSAAQRSLAIRMGAEYDKGYEAGMESFARANRDSIDRHRQDLEQHRDGYRQDMGTLTEENLNSAWNLGVLEGFDAARRRK